MKPYQLRLIACLFIFLNSNSLAALVDNGHYFTNTETNTDYLKLGQTVNKSWNDVVTNDLLGFIADGWQVASQTAYFNMATHIDTRDDMWLLCDVCQVPANGNAQPWTNGDASNGQFLLPVNAIADFYISVGNYSKSTFTFNADAENALIAVALSRPTAVPVPAALILFLSGLISLGMFSIKKKQPY